MKQHITIDQLNELSEKGKEKLHKWWEEKSKNMHMYDRYKYAAPSTYIEDIDANVEYWSEKKDNPAYPIFISLDGLPLFSIGQMIEFLDYYLDELYIEKYGIEQRWRLKLGIVNSNVKVQKKGDLCDSLWKSVKKILER